MFNDLSEGETSSVFLAVFHSVIISIGVIYFMRNINKKISLYFNIFSFVLMIYSFLIIWMLPTSDVRNVKIGYSLPFISQYFILCFFYWSFRNNKHIDSFFEPVIICIMLIIDIVYMLTFSEFSALVNEGSAFGNSYYPLLMLPFVVALSNKLWRNILMCIIIVITLTSLKRGGLIALSLSFFTYYLVSVYCTKAGSMFKSIIIAFLFILIFFMSVSWFDTKFNDNHLKERMEQMSEDGGSGRADYYAMVWNKITDSSAQELITGHGYLSTIQVTGKYTAHNDFLELLYDFGILFFIFYIVFWYKYAKYCIKHIKQRTKYATALSVSFVLVLTLSVFSHIFIYLHLVTLMMFIGMITGIDHRQKTNIKSKKLYSV